MHATRGRQQGTLQTGEDWNYVGGVVDEYTKKGKGQQCWSDGFRYEGRYEGGKMDGDGTFTWPTGEKYVGAWHANQMEGEGAFTFASGAVYTGTFVAGKFHGKGKLTLSNVPTETGDFVQVLASTAAAYLLLAAAATAAAVSPARACVCGCVCVFIGGGRGGGVADTTQACLLLAPPRPASTAIWPSEVCVRRVAAPPCQAARRLRHVACAPTSAQPVPSPCAAPPPSPSHALTPRRRGHPRARAVPLALPRPGGGLGERRFLPASRGGQGRQEKEEEEVSASAPPTWYTHTARRGGGRGMRSAWSGPAACVRASCVRACICPPPAGLAEGRPNAARGAWPMLSAARPGCVVRVTLLRRTPSPLAQAVQWRVC